MASEDTMLRRYVRETYPHVRLSIKTVGFSDLARGDGRFALFKGVQSPEEWKDLEERARDCGLVPSG